MKEVRFQDMFRWGMSRDVPAILSFPSGPIINLGSGRKALPYETTNLDLPDWDARRDTIPFGDEEVAGVVAYHFFEHLDGSTATKVVEEINRVLKPGGSALIVVPYYNSQLQHQNLDHKSSWTEETFKNLFTDTTYDREGGRIDWRLKIGFQLICGIVERNICLATQLVKL